MTKERIEIVRQSLIPFVRKELLEINFEGLGKFDADEFEKDLNEILNLAIKALEQQGNTWSLDDAREDFMHDVFNTLDFLPTNNQANRIIDSFDRVTSGIEQQPSDETIKYLECNDIDVQEFIKAMKRQPLQVVNPNSMQLIFEQMNRPTSDDCVSRKDVLEMFGYETAIYDLPPVTPTQRWIPVSERLPESEGLYLVSVKNDHLRQYSKTCWFNSHRNWFSRQDVIAWQPLPKPYEEKRGNENE